MTDRREVKEVDEKDLDGSADGVHLVDALKHDVDGSHGHFIDAVAREKITEQVEDASLACGRGSEGLTPQSDVVHLEEERAAHVVQLAQLHRQGGELRTEGRSV